MAQGIRRAGTYPVTIKTPLPPAQYSKIFVTFAQDNAVVVEKKLGDSGFVINGDRVEVTLTQNETLLFKPSASTPMGRERGMRAFMQCRCYKNSLDAPASCTWPLEVYDALKAEVIS